jgi:hypothetical protein
MKNEPHVAIFLGRLLAFASLGTEQVGAKARRSAIRFHCSRKTTLSATSIRQGSSTGVIADNDSG